MSEDFAEQPKCPSCSTVLVDQGSGYRCRHCGLAYLPPRTTLDESEAQAGFVAILDLSDDKRYVALALALDQYAGTLEHMASEQERSNEYNSEASVESEVTAWREMAHTTRTLAAEIELQLDAYGAGESYSE